MLMRRVGAPHLQMPEIIHLDVSITSAIAKYGPHVVDFFSHASIATIKLATILWTGEISIDGSRKSSQYDVAHCLLSLDITDKQQRR
jgi:hypothetical protein